MNLKLKKAFTLVELSIVILVLGILSAGVLVSRRIIQTANVESIGREFTQTAKNYQVFYNNYGYIPGDVSIADLCTQYESSNSKYFNTGADCAAATPSSLFYNANSYLNNTTNAVARNGFIEGPAESGIAIKQMILTGNMSNNCANSQIITTFNTTQKVPTICGADVYIDPLGIITSLSGSINVNNLKTANFSTSVAVVLFGIGTSMDIVNANLVTNNYTVSGVIGGTSIGLFTEAYLADSTSNRYQLGVGANKYQGNVIGMMNTNITYGALDQNTAYQVDVKYDDGKPYVGLIVAGKAPKQFKSTPVKGCTNLAITTTNTLSANQATFLSSFSGAKYDLSLTLGNGKANGCNLFYTLPRL